MGKQSYMCLFMAFFVLAQGVTDLFEGSIEASSALFNRQKRASSSSGLKPKLLPERPHPQKRGQREESSPGVVKVMSGTVQIGIGIVVHPLAIAAENSIFSARVNYHVEFRGANGEIISRNITDIRPSYKFTYLRELPGGKNDVALAVTSGHMPFNNVPTPGDANPIYSRLLDVGQFSAYQISCINRMLRAIKERLDARAG